MSLLMTKGGRCLPHTMVIIATVIALTGCVSRPTSDVLKPVALKADQQKKVSILAVTNRDPVAKDASYGSRWAGATSYDQFSISVPSKRDGPNIRYVSKTPDPKRQYIVTGRQALTKASLVQKTISAPQFDGTAAVFVHGYNYSYQEALFRTAQMVADAGAVGTPIMFSWPSAASVAGYVADRDAVLYSRTELGSLLETIAATPKVKRIILFGHSMGGFLSMEAARQLRLEGRSNVLAKLQIVLAAPDIDLDVFRAQIRDIGAIPTPITLLVSKSDKALSFSSFVGGERPRVGSLDVNDPVIQETAKAERVRVVDISSLKSADGLGHDRYASLAQFAGNIDKAEARMRLSGGNIGAFVFDAAGAAVASPFKLAGQIARQ
ncbi:alpha/beta hydrolase [Rhizobium skierniewicense]|uniref:alpha/beta hydrolase n=1 Tax=Rhizobium skierniewicense TaxID=984260 RepID=UPI001F211A24|nr:alpha/beta fold hydrolase [Rhizobium skierniewicense]